ncbi:MAG: hypothetical protein BGN88_03755 [Clostridiales bacterium 43-6]|nr:MAG: hypothetical protein BGN88_03755 [Clostridiales bacterium 43-6]
MFYKIAWLIIYPFFRALFWIQYIGKENLPKDKGVIVCSNHISNADPFFIGFGFRTPIHFIAKEELFHNPVLAWVLKKINAFPIKRGTGDMDALNVGADLLKNGERMGIFPEGRRSRDGKPGHAKSGIAMVASLAKADVVPAAIICKGKVRPFKKIKVIYGKAIPYESLKISGEVRGEYRKVASVIMTEITKLWEDGHAN